MDYHYKSEILIQLEHVGAPIAVDARHDGGLLVLADPLLKEVSLSLQRDQLHPVKRVLSIVHLPVP